MQVRVFMARIAGELTSKLLVMPDLPKAALSKSFRRTWRFYGTIDSENPLFDGVAVELHLRARGYAIGTVGCGIGGMPAAPMKLSAR
jgi:hypothetical protein